MAQVSNVQKTWKLEGVIIAIAQSPLH